MLFYHYHHPKLRLSCLPCVNSHPDPDFLILAVDGWVLSGFLKSLCYRTITTQGCPLPGDSHTSSKETRHRQGNEVMDTCIYVYVASGTQQVISGLVFFTSLKYFFLSWEDGAISEVLA